MKLITGMNHLTLLTADIDRFIGFYQRVFDAKLVLDLEEEGLRHALIEIGEGTYLHPFQIPGMEPPGQQPMFQRGRLDHFAFNASSEEAFRKLHSRVMAEGRDDGAVTDMGVMWLFSFTDPDEGRYEVVWMKSELSDGPGVRRAEWSKVDLA